MLYACQKHFDEKYFCPHCRMQLTCCSVPPFHVGDGLGWGSEYMYICLNDDCSLFVNGWRHIEEQYGHVSSYRYMQLPGEQKGTPMMVASKDAFKGCEVDTESLKLQNERYVREKEALAQLDTCVAEKNLAPVLALLIDEAAEINARKRACELLCAINDLTCIDPLRNHKFRDPSLEHGVNMAISQILKANYKKECPSCTEIVKAQAKICQHCKQGLQ